MSPPPPTSLYSSLSTEQRARPSLLVLEHLLLNEVGGLGVAEERVAKVLGRVVVADVLVDAVEPGEVLGRQEEDVLDVLLQPVRVGRLWDDRDWSEEGKKSAAGRGGECAGERVDRLLWLTPQLRTTPEGLLPYSGCAAEGEARRSAGRRARKGRVKLKSERTLSELEHDRVVDDLALVLDDELCEGRGRSA